MSGEFGRCILCGRSGTLEQHTVLYPLRRELPVAIRATRGQAFYGCRHCGFVFDVLAQPPLAAAYEEDYRTRYDPTSIGRSCRVAEAATLAVELKKAAAPLARVLEVGPGPGWFLEGFREHSPQSRYDVVELTSYFAQVCRDRGAHAAYHADFARAETVLPLRGQYDLVVSVHSIEHFFDPRACLLNLLRCVRPGGLLYVHTPNGARAGETDWWHFHPEHLAFFSEQVFRSVAPLFGFELLSSRVLYDDNDLVCLLRVLPGLDWRLRREWLARRQRPGGMP